MVEEEEPLRVCVSKEGKEYLFRVLTLEGLRRQDDIKAAEKETGEWYEERAVASTEGGFY